MPEKLAKLPIGTIKRIAKEAVPDIRISKKALERLQDVITDFTRVVIMDSQKLAGHRNRKTVEEKDILMATS
jgi:histone H3/H4